MGFHPYSTPYDWSRLGAAKQLASAYPDGMIDLSIGSPVDAVPDSVRQALADTSNAANAYGYPLAKGTAALRQAVTDWFLAERGVDFAAIDADLVPTQGSKEAVSLMASLLGLGEGDVVVQPRISYPTYEIGSQLAGASTVKTDVECVESWENVPNVKLVWVNSPSNPTGKILDVDQLHAIVAAARRIGAIVVSDECYALMTWNEDEDDQTITASPCILDPKVNDGSAKGLLCLYSMSKQSNMAGYRTAAIAGDSQLIGPMIDARKQIGQIISGPSQAAMVAGLQDNEAVLKQHPRYQRRLRRLVQGLRSFGYDAEMPQGALYIWVRSKSGDCWQDIDDLARLGIVVAPGEFYGDAGFIRVSATATDEHVEAAVRRLGA